RELIQHQRMNPHAAAVRAALSEAEAALNRVEPLTGVVGHANEVRQNDAALAYRYLRGVLLRMRGDFASASQSLSELARDCEKQGDKKTEAKCYMQLAQISIDTIARAPKNAADASRGESAVASREQVEGLRNLKLERRATIKKAAEYAQRAVSLFRKMDSSPEDELTVTALPSLHFQASYLAARLQIVLATVDSQILRLDGLLSAGQPDGHATGATTFPSGVTTADRRQRAIELLEDAVRQAERPTSSTTQIRLQRAKFFSRYAPAYDLLVDLYVATAVGQKDVVRLDQSSNGFADMRRAIEVADLARNRTFREQIDGWRQTAGSEQKSISFDWNSQLREIVDPDTALLMYHLDGPQLLNEGATRAGIDVTPIGGGHLFVVLHQGREIRYYRLRYLPPSASQDIAFSRGAAQQLVRHHIDWIENPESTRDWGHAEQRALTECLLPHDLLDLLGYRSPDSGNAEPQRAHAADAAPASPIHHLLIVPDGALHQLPFESLLLPEANGGQNRRIQYVIDELPPIRYGASLSVLAGIVDRKVGRSEPPNRVLTVGNPLYPNVPRQNEIPSWHELLWQISNQNQGFVQLVHSQEECESVYASFADLPSASRTKLVQAAATEAAVRKYIGSSRVIHIAAHGCVDYQDDNLYGALVVTPGANSNDPQNDGLLQLREIYGLNLSHCDLAVLSACQTYAGPQRPLEAGTSMARAFLEQGAKRVVCSQWSTDDRATTELMKSFFDAMRTARQGRNGIDYAAALQHAKLAIRRDPNRGSLPKYWAAFVLVGAR
ncbi:MAG TPA: CHAT domain-containing protein, partial [Lacipirellulaceae bacterium]|nr:CHAT domain-containing protein [Lacipirellulaceae bacterium]